MDARTSAVTERDDSGRQERPRLERERDALLDDLRAARMLYATYDPDSPPWAAEPEVRRLELRLRGLAAESERPAG